MGIYRDSVGGSYARIVHGKSDQPHKAKPSKGGTAKYERSKRRPRVGNGDCGCIFCRNNRHAFH